VIVTLSPKQKRSRILYKDALLPSAPSIPMETSLGTSSWEGSLSSKACVSSDAYPSVGR